MKSSSISRILVGLTAMLVLSSAASAEILKIVVNDDLEDFCGGSGTQNQHCREPDQDPRNGAAFHPSGHLQYSYSYLRLATDISSVSLFPEAADGGSLQPGRLVLPVMRRAPRSYVKYDHAH